MAALDELSRAGGVDRASSLDGVETVRSARSAAARVVAPAIGRGHVRRHSASESRSAPVMKAAVIIIFGPATVSPGTKLTKI